MCHVAESEFIILSSSRVLHDKAEWLKAGFWGALHVQEACVRSIQASAVCEQHHTAYVHLCCSARTCVDGYVGFSKGAEGLVEPLIQLQAAMVGCSGNAEHHHTKPNGALLIVLELCVAAPQEHPGVGTQPLEVGCVSRVPAVRACITGVSVLSMPVCSIAS